MTNTAPSGPTPTRTPVSWADLVPRLISGGIIVVVIGTVLTLGGVVFAIAVAIVFALIYREWDQMVTLAPVAPFGMGLMALVAISAVAFPFIGWSGTALCIAAAALASLAVGRLNWNSWWRAGGLVFFGLVIVALLAMRGDTLAGAIAGWFLGIVISWNDTGAYFTGRLIGGEKLVPAISPAKTWSGAIGGWVIGTLGGTVFWLIFVPGSPWYIGLILAGLLGIVGQGGDLTESWIKRRFRIKDSGDIIPGHGGLMDRLDSTTFGALFLFAVGFIHGGGITAVASGFLNW
ncbi:MAG: phosphatidate cytidylyltransferase [Devosia sp.]